MNALEKIIHSQIEQSGPMDVGQFMNLALSHPEHGYYMKQDPLGVGGDFVTAPEVSQMFGEIVGAWAAHSWMQMGAPEAFVILECGPGRGTLMADMMRACAGVKGFCNAAQVHLLEISPVLKARQGEALAEYDVQWHDDFTDVPDDLPIIIVANEFFDALPFRSLVYLDGAWFERVVAVSDGVLVFGTRACPEALWPSFGAPKVGDVYEFSSARSAVMEAMAGRMKAHSGAALIVDYGHGVASYGDTFQGVRGHEYADVLKGVGDADLTSHVDFSALIDVAKGQGCAVAPLAEQGAFLRILGIEARAAYLSEKCSEQQAAALGKGLHRLIDGGEMGALFKVMDVRYGF